MLIVLLAELPETFLFDSTAQLFTGNLVGCHPAGDKAMRAEAPRKMKEVRLCFELFT